MIRLATLPVPLSALVSGVGRCFSLLVLLLAWTFSSPVVADQVTVAVAINFVKPLELLKPLYEKASGHTLVVSGGSTGRLYAQIKNGAPYDVFLSADERHPRLLEEEGHGVAKTRFTYAVGRLVLWSSKNEMLGSDGPSILKSMKFSKLAITNPKLAPYGLAAQQTLERLQLWEKIQTRIVLGENVGQTYSMVYTGNAELGFIAKSQVKEVEGGITGSYWEVPSDLHAPILQQAILLVRSNNNPAAHAFIRFLRGEVARKLIADFGYGLE